ncbi:hypothetical protein [Parapedobacter soli]|uniref:hypothetical protein n=1 Tax=Parapedobacter soli TaxID=416955 RepID=UPI0021C5CDBC|nr:hypothetical protein [Parapedobacter soli]
MDSEEKKLIDEIRDGLNNFEIPYEEGNWENFQKSYIENLDEEKQKRRRAPLILWKYISAAAVLIGVMIYIPWHWNGQEDAGHDRIAEHRKVSIKDKGPSLPIQDKSDTKVVSTRDDQPIGQTVNRTFITNQGVVDNTVMGLNADDTSPVIGMHAEVSTPPSLASPTITEETMASSGWKETTIASIDHPEQHKTASGRWKFGIEVNSSITTDKPNVAAGILTEFEVSEKLKLSTGLTYSRISAIHDTDPVQLSYDTKMIGGESMIKAIDIPLTVVYEPTDGWYASVGVSALAVLDEDKIYRMESEVLRENVVTDPTSGASVSVFEVVKNEYSEKSMDTDFEGRSNLRYLNLSIGRRQRFNKRTDLLFEPFIKIPMGGLQRGDVNLLNSGIKIKVLF